MVAPAGERPLNGENIAYRDIATDIQFRIGGEVDIALAIITFPLKP